MLFRSLCGNGEKSNAFLFNLVARVRVSPHAAVLMLLYSLPLPFLFIAFAFGWFRLKFNDFIESRNGNEFKRIDRSKYPKLDTRLEKKKEQRLNEMNAVRPSFAYTFSKFRLIGFPNRSVSPSWLLCTRPSVCPDVTETER